MDVLIVSATDLEIKPFVKTLDLIHAYDCNCKHYQWQSNTVDIMITGVGLVAMTYQLTRFLQTNKKKYDLLINVGIAGSYSEDLPIGTIVNVIQDQFADIGIQTKESFQTLFDSRLLDKEEVPFDDGVLTSQLPASFYRGQIQCLKKVSGLTVSMASGQNQRIDYLTKRFKADIESMEGAAFFYVCHLEQQACLQLRAISNRVAERDKRNWDIPLAVSHLTESLHHILTVLFRKQ